MPTNSKKYPDNNKGVEPTTFKEQILLNNNKLNNNVDNILSKSSTMEGVEALINAQKETGPVLLLFSLLFGYFFCCQNNNHYPSHNNNNKDSFIRYSSNFSNETLISDNYVGKIIFNNFTNYSFITFFVISVIEIIIHLSVNRLFKLYLVNKKVIDFLNVCRVILMCILYYILQIIYGINCPIYIIVTYKIIIVANIFHCSRLLFGICVTTFIFTSAASYLHAICNFYNLNFTNLIYAMFYKQNNEYNLEHYNQKLFEIIFLEIAVGVVSWFFGLAITKQKHVNMVQRIEIENEKILSSAKTKFIGNLSHEARNNLNCLVGAVHLLNSYHKKGENKTHNCCKHCIITNPSINELIQDISDNANLLLKIFTRSLQMSTLELGDVKLNIQPFNLLSLFESMISVYSPLANEKGVSLHSFFNFTKVPIYLLGDHVRISQIFMNIISNAIKYTNKNGCVTVICNLADDSEIKEVLDKHNSHNKEKSNKEEDLLTDEDYHFVKIECIDTGKGISEQGLNELFTPFHTLDDKTQQKSTTTANTQTTFDRYFSQSEQLKDNNVSVLLLQNRHGLGLSICKILIERMNGIISVKSKVNEGTTMTIVLPLKKVEVDINRTNDSTANNTDDENVIQITTEEQKFKEIERLKKSITKKYLLNIILMDNDKFFKECIYSYFNSFTSLIDHQLTTCSSPDEIENNISKDNLNAKNIIICCEEQFYSIQEKLKLLINHNKKINYQIVPTTLRTLPRKEKCFYLTKPIKLLDILEFLFEQLREFIKQEQQLLTFNNDLFIKKKKKKTDLLLNHNNTLLSFNEVNISSSTIDYSDSTVNINKKIRSESIITVSQEYNNTMDNNNNNSTFPLLSQTNNKRNLSALVVDDVATNVKILKKLLEIIGFTEIDTASNGLECFEKFKQKKYSIILLDCLMPVLNGIQSCEMIRNYEKDCNLERTTIFAITANVFESKESLIEKGFTSVLYKPITLSTLKQEIKLFIENIK
ncbi:hypothetical protein ABK040_013310 [Willaertia magna]